MLQKNYAMSVPPIDLSNKFSNLVNTIYINYNNILFLYINNMFKNFKKQSTYIFNKDIEETFIRNFNNKFRYVYIKNLFDSNNKTTFKLNNTITIIENCISYNFTNIIKSHKIVDNLSCKSSNICNIKGNNVKEKDINYLKKVNLKSSNNLNKNNATYCVVIKKL